MSADQNGVVTLEAFYKAIAREALDRDLPAVSGSGTGVNILCVTCYPERDRTEFESEDGRSRSWWAWLTRRGSDDWGCTGVVTIRLPRPPRGAQPRRPSDLVAISDTFDALEIEECGCHYVDESIEWNWPEDWRAEVVARLVDARREHGDEWDAQVVRAAEAHEAAVEKARARAAVIEIAREVVPRARAQAIASVLVDAGCARVEVEQGRIWWECGHLTETGEWARVLFLLGQSGLPIRHAPQWEDEGSSRLVVCTLPHAEPSLSALAEKLAEVAKMTPEEQAAWRPVKETGKGRGRAGASSGRAAAKPKPSLEEAVQSARAWLDAQRSEDGSLLIPPTIGQNAAWELAKQFKDHPTRRAVEKAQGRRKSPSSP